MKLTPADVEAVRASDRTGAEEARARGVSEALISRIRRGQRRAPGVPDPRRDTDRRSPRLSGVTMLRELRTAVAAAGAERGFTLSGALTEAARLYLALSPAERTALLAEREAAIDAEIARHAGGGEKSSPEP